MTRPYLDDILRRIRNFDPGRFFIPILILCGLVLRLAIVCREDFYFERDSLFNIYLVNIFDLGKFSNEIGACPGPLFITILKVISICAPSNIIGIAMALNISVSIIGSVAFYLILKELDLKHSKLLALLFAAHPVVIRNSCQILREPAYLTFMILCGYFLVVAVKKDRYHLFALSGICSLTAFLFRYEACEIWLLFPILMYPFVKNADDGRRFRRTVNAAIFFYLPVFMTILILWAVYPKLLSFILQRISIFVNHFIS